jgi:hypothetical protein
MPKRLLTKYGIKVRKGEKVVLKRDTLVRKPRPKSHTTSRDKIEQLIKLKKQGKNGDYGSKS